MALLRGSGGWPSDRGLLVEYDEASTKGTSSCKDSAVHALVRFYVEHVAAPDPAGRDLPGARGVRVLRADHRPLQLQNLHPTSDAIAKPLEARLTLLRECAGIAGRDPAPIGSSFCE